MVEKMGITQSQADPCVLCKLDHKCELELIISVNVGDYTETSIETSINSL